MIRFRHMIAQQQLHFLLTDAVPSRRNGSLPPKNETIRENRTIVLKTEHLTRVVFGKRLVDDITIAIEKGEVVAVVGPSGSGKTSFFRLLDRLDQPTAGAGFLGGADHRGGLPR